MFCCSDIALNFDFGFFVVASCVPVISDGVWDGVGCDIFFVFIFMLFLCCLGCFDLMLIFMLTVCVDCFGFGMSRVDCVLVRSVWMNHIRSILADLSVLSV